MDLSKYPALAAAVVICPIVSVDEVTHITHRADRVSVIKSYHDSGVEVQRSVVPLPVFW